MASTNIYQHSSDIKPCVFCGSMTGRYLEKGTFKRSRRTPKARIHTCLDCGQAIRDAITQAFADQRVAVGGPASR